MLSFQQFLLYESMFPLSLPAAHVCLLIMGMSLGFACGLNDGEWLNACVILI